MGKFEPLLAYEASAGSGKTFNLVVRYLSLLLMGEKQSSIVALTFTNKAANEMLSRVVEVLTQLEQRTELAEIAKVSGLSCEEILEKREAVLNSVLKNELKISTIDTFFGTIMRKFSLHLGLMPTFVAATGHHETKFLKRFLHEVHSTGATDDLMKMALLSDKRLEGIFGLLSMLYTKHKELEGVNFAPMLASHDNIGEIMVLAYELKALMETKELSPRARKTMEFNDYDELLKQAWVFKESLNYWDFRKTYEPKMDTLLFQIQEAVLRQMKQYEVEFLARLRTLLTLYVKSRKALMITNNELTFDDITLMVHELLRGKLDSEFLYFRLDATMKHLLLDEFQDTSVIQFDILRPLIEEIVAGEGSSNGGSFFFVGDVKQSIYRFRGGTSELFYQVADHFDVNVMALETNYRSCGVVVDFVNRIFETKMQRYIPQKAVKEGGFVEVVMCDEPLQDVVLRIQELKMLGIFEEDIAVLCATNSDAAALQESLELNDMRVQSEATSRLIHQQSVAGVIEYLRYCYFGEAVYAHNACELLEIAYDTLPRVMIVDLQRQTLEFILRYELGGASILVFMESLSAFKDIEALIFEIDRLETPAPQSQLQGLRLMTVHKSKGLEFEHVIVMDRLGRMSTRSETIVYDYDGVVLQNLYVRTYGRETLDEEYAQALQKEKNLSHDDQMNALYVAMTRAVQSLCVVAKSKSSWFEPLELTVGQWGEKHFEQSVIQEPILLKSIEYVPQSYGKQSVEEPDDDVVKELDFDAIEYGLALHYGLEMLEAFELHSVDNAIGQVRKRHGMVLGDERIMSIKNSLESVVRDEFFRELIRGKIYKEQSFVYKQARGIIDLLIEHELGYWVVVDYKSGEDKSQEYTAQVLRYMDAVASLTQCEVRGYICSVGLHQCKWRKVER